MKEITYNGLTVYISDDVLSGVRTYIALHERPVHSHFADAGFGAPPQAYMAPPQASQAPLPYMMPSQASEAAAPKRKRRIFDSFKISHKKESAKAEREEVCKDSESAADRPPVPQEMHVGAGPIDDILSNAEDTFQTHLLKLIDKKELVDSDVYKKAEIDRRHFSKIRSNPDYRPKKQTALALAFALELNIDEAVDLLGRAGYAFSPSSRFDLITRYCIEHGIYDLLEVNALLFTYDQPLLGGQM